MTSEVKVEVAIIGGGITGCVIAYNLAKRDVPVTVLERSYIASGATGRCGGGIRQQFTTTENIELAMASMKIFKQLDTELNHDTEFVQGGYLVLAHSDDELDAFRDNIELQRRMGLDVELVERDEIHELASVLDLDTIGAVGAAFCPTDGHVNPFKVTEAYAKNAIELGAELRTFTAVNGIRVKDKGFIINTNRGKLDAQVIVNAAGGHSKEVARMVGVELPTRPYRHEILVTEGLEHVLDPMVISFHDGIYFCQHKSGNIVGGIGNPHEPVGVNTRSSLAFLARMAKGLARYVPRFKWLNVLRQWAGLYDVTPDARPILGYVDDVENFINVCGYSGHGFMIAPAVGKLISELIADGKPSMPIDHLHLNRFKGKVVHEAAVVG